MQDQHSGAEANNWGRSTAQKLADLLGATPPSGSSNECTLGGKRIVIKCAARRTTSVGVTFQMLKRIDAVLGAFESHDGSFEVWRLEPTAFKASMRDTRSKGASAGKVGIVPKSAFEKLGRSLGRVRLP